VSHYQPPPRFPRTQEEMDAEASLRRERIKAGMSGGNVFAEVWAVIRFVVTLPWRAIRWIGSKVAREERVGS